ncbi:uncharacterized protein LOC102801218 [Saccoglossus kowalevskii]|uniref:Uncharacterized protein LOC102801218 n=1 Tax=Saccoglossus kowalevskii TaxID=10224 RepID=A0ABM0MRD5_SACKO|nr:PREDICTED: uncharacterized protein LOC102801218 [Saccoglossus kowalevskii]
MFVNNVFEFVPSTSMWKTPLTLLLFHVCWCVLTGRVVSNEPTAATTDQLIFSSPSASALNHQLSTVTDSVALSSSIATVQRDFPVSATIMLTAITTTVEQTTQSDFQFNPTSSEVTVQSTHDAIRTTTGNGRTDTTAITEASTAEAHPWDGYPLPDFTNIKIVVGLAIGGTPCVTLLVFAILRCRAVYISKHKYNSINKGNLGLSTVSLAASASSYETRGNVNPAMSSNTLSLPSSTSHPSSSMSDVNASTEQLSV